MSILKSLETYIDDHNIEATPEQLFIEFESIKRTHIEFEKYLKENHLNQHLEKMQRSERLLEKRKLFSNWYILMNQNNTSIKEALINISEITFVATKTVQRDIKK